MKRTTTLILVMSAVLLLGGCWPYWHEHGEHGRDHYNHGYHEGQEYSR
jgi:hypothetical protein